MLSYVPKGSIESASGKSESTVAYIEYSPTELGFSHAQRGNILCSHHHAVTAYYYFIASLEMALLSHFYAFLVCSFVVYSQSSGRKFYQKLCLESCSFDSYGVGRDATRSNHSQDYDCFIKKVKCIKVISVIYTTIVIIVFNCFVLNCKGNVHEIHARISVHNQYIMSVGPKLIIYTLP